MANIKPNPAEAKIDAYRRVLAYAVSRLRHHDVPGFHEDFQFIDRELRDVGEAFAWPSRELTLKREG